MISQLSSCQFFQFRNIVDLLSLPCINTDLRELRYDCFDISTEKDSFYCYPTKQNVVTKLSFATEELYKVKMEERARRKAERAKEKAGYVYSAF